MTPPLKGIPSRPFPGCRPQTPLPSARNPEEAEGRAPRPCAPLASGHGPSRTYRGPGTGLPRPRPLPSLPPPHFTSPPPGAAAMPVTGNSKGVCLLLRQWRPLARSLKSWAPIGQNPRRGGFPASYWQSGARGCSHNRPSGSLAELSAKCCRRESSQPLSILERRSPAVSEPAVSVREGGTAFSSIRFPTELSWEDRQDLPPPAFLFKISPLQSRAERLCLRLLTTLLVAGNKCLETPRRSETLEGVPGDHYCFQSKLENLRQSCGFLLSLTEL